MAKRKVTASRKKEYDSVRKAIDRKKKKIQPLEAEINTYISKGKKTPPGLRGKLSDLRSELVELNKKFIKVSREVGIDNRKREKVKKLPEREIKGNEVYDQTVWQGEDTLKQVIKKGSFKTIYIVNQGQVFKNPYAAGLVLASYDLSRNEAYNKRNSTTPFVTITENLSLKQISFHILS